MFSHTHKQSTHSFAATHEAHAIPAAWSTLDTSQFEQEVREQRVDEWQRRGQRMALKLFHAAAERVPAYKHFLRMYGVNHRSVRTMRDFQHVPLVDKKNYVHAYPLSSLCWDGDPHRGGIISSSSGSSGAPTYWPRYAVQEDEATVLHELMFKEVFEIDRYSTLVVNCFSMGIYIAGVLTANCIAALGRKGYPLCMVTPGIDVGGIVRTVVELAPSFGQIILVGYPPFVKDVLDSGKEAGIDWKRLRVRFLFAAEGFSEQWRTHMHRAVGSAQDYATSLNIYGTADAAMMGHETPLSIFVRRAAVADPELAYHLFGRTDRLPTLVNYYPTLRFFERVSDELVCTAPAGMPLVRYNVHDDGDVIPFSRVQTLWNAAGRSLAGEMRAVGCGHFLHAVPFVYLFGRSDFSATLYGLNVYPEHVEVAVQHERALCFLTGRFVLETTYRENFDQCLKIKFELLHGAVAVDVQFAEWFGDHILKTLLRVNGEFAALFGAIGDRARPVLEFYEYHHPIHFGQGVKHKWKK